MEDVEILFSIIGERPQRQHILARIPPTNWERRCRIIWPACVGYPERILGEGLSEEVAASVKGALAVLEGLGAKLKPISLPHSAYSIDTYLTLVTAEASSNLKPAATTACVT